jgi:excisionase family DNA binding protein
MDERLLSPDAAAERLGVAPKTVRAWLRTGKVRGVRAGRLWRLRPEDLPGRRIDRRAQPIGDGAAEPTAIEPAASASGRAAKLREMRHREGLLADLAGSTMFTIDLPAVMAKAVAYVVQVLDVEYAGVFEWQPDAATLLLRTGAHWEAERVGRATLNAGRDSYGWQALQGRGPLVVEDWAAESRFDMPDLLADHEILSGIVEVVPGRSEPFGLLAAYSASQRTFSLHDLGFLHAVAGVLARAVDLKRIVDERDALAAGELAARREAEAAQRRLAFLAEAGALLASSPDYGATLGRLARLAVGHLADWCLIEVVGEAAADHRLVVAHRDPVRETAAQEVLRRHGLDTGAGPPLHQDLSAGHALYAPEVQPASLVAYARDARHLELLRELCVSSFLSVPMVAHARLLGTLSFAAAEPGRRYGPADLLLAEDLARRVALMVENALLYRAALGRSP